MAAIKDAVTDPTHTIDEIFSDLLTNNRKAIEKAEGGYCCNCSRFMPAELMYWLPTAKPVMNPVDDTQCDAQCPYCLVDAVLAKDVPNVVQVGAQYKLANLSPTGPEKHVHIEAGGEEES